MISDDFRKILLLSIAYQAEAIADFCDNGDWADKDTELFKRFELMKEDISYLKRKSN